MAAGVTVCYRPAAIMPPLSLAAAMLLLVPSRYRNCAGVALAMLALPGCALWPWAQKERTSIITPPMRAATVREIGARARDADQAKQQEMCEQLAGQIRTEPDPIVRRAIQESAGKFNVPLAETMLLA